MEPLKLNARLSKRRNEDTVREMNSTAADGDPHL